MNYQVLLEEVYDEVQHLNLRGRLANYIPELSSVNPENYGICLIDLEGNVFGTGNYQDPFSIQSISKVFTLSMVYDHMKKSPRHRVDVEPSGNPFNSLIQLEKEMGIPRNPFINRYCYYSWAIGSHKDKIYMNYNSFFPLSRSSV